MFDATRLPMKPSKLEVPAETAASSVRGEENVDTETPVVSPYPAKSLTLDCGRYRVIDSKK